MAYKCKSTARDILNQFAQKNNWSPEIQLEIMLFWADQIFEFRNDNDSRKFKKRLVSK